jgi:hypothetical protein
MRGRQAPVADAHRSADGVGPAGDVAPKGPQSACARLTTERSLRRAELYNDRPVLGVAFCGELQRAMPVAHGLRRARVTPGGAGVTRRSMLVVRLGFSW